MTKLPAVIVTGLPWIRSGTGKVMQAQIEYFKSRGWKVIFIACPFRRTDAYSRRIWKRFEHEKVELNADITAIASFWRRVSRPNIAQRFRGRWQGRNAMHWALEAGQAAHLPRRIVSLAGEFDIKLLLVNHVYTLPVARKLRASLSTLAPIALVTHDIQSYVLIDNSEINPFTQQVDTVEVLLDTELQALSAADHLIHVSRDDEEFFRNRLPSLPHSLVLPTIYRRFKDGNPGDEIYASDFIFVGAKHIANYHAVRWLLEEVWPWIDQRQILKIVGSVKDLIESRRPDLYAKFGSAFTGSVPDVSRYYRESRCALVPMITGRGVSIKTIEACAFGLPMVGTSLAYRGLPKEDVEGAGLSAYDEPKVFAEAALSALDKPAPFREASRRLYQMLFSREAFRKSMDEVFAELTVVNNPS